PAMKKPLVSETRESRGKVGAVSSASALGLMQLADSSASDAARKLGLPRPTRDQLLTDGALNVRLGANHVAWLLEHEGSNLERVLVAYNAGRTKLRRWIAEAGSWKAWRKERDAAGDSSVLAYARNVLAARDELRRRGRLGSADS
ncbi:MAG: transglycosylase SLT domain-containing protein, partial [Planctomycetota bacterium]